MREEKSNGNEKDCSEVSIEETRQGEEGGPSEASGKLELPEDRVVSPVAGRLKKKIYATFHAFEGEFHN